MYIDNPFTTRNRSFSTLNNKKLVLGAKDELLLLESETKEIISISKEFKGRINCLIKLSNGSIASGGKDNIIKIWDIDKMQVI